MKRREFVKTVGGSVALASLPLPGFVQERQIATRAIPSSGELLPIVGFGQSPSFREGDFENSFLLLDALRELGGRFVDTGTLAQPVIGRYMQQFSAQDKLFPGVNIRTPSADQDLQAITSAKQALGQETLDLLQLQRPDDYRTQWPRMRRWREEGHARHIGVAVTGDSFFAMVEDLLKNGKPDFIQINYSMLEPETGDRLLPLAHDKGVAVVTNRPFMNGQYFPRVSGRDLPEWAADFDCESWAQFSLKWIVANPIVNCALAETTKVHHAIDNLSAGLGRLPDEATRVRMQDYIRSL